MSGNELKLERQYDASPATVWRCLTEPELLKQWFAPKPVVITELKLELFPGGTFKLAMDVPDFGLIDEPAGCVLVVEPQARLVWTSSLGPGFQPMRHGDGPMEFPMTAEMTLTARDGGTHYVARALHANPEDGKKHEGMGFYDGWGTTADQLGELAKTL